MNNNSEMENQDKVNSVSNDTQPQCIVGNKLEPGALVISKNQLNYNSNKNDNDCSNTIGNVNNTGVTADDHEIDENIKSSMEEVEKTNIDMDRSDNQANSELLTENELASKTVTRNQNTACSQTRQENVDCNGTLQNDNTNNVDSNINLDDIASKETTSLGTSIAVSGDSSSSSNKYLLPCSLIDNSDAFTTASSEIVRNEAIQSSVHLLCRGNRINPTPNEFDMIEEKDYESANLILLHGDNSVVISNSNAVPQAESIVPSNFSLAQLRGYGSDESLIEESPTVLQVYRDGNNGIEVSDKDSDSDSSSTSSSTSILISDSSDSECGDGEYENFTVVHHKPIKAKGELDLQDLPPIEDLTISVPEDECIPIGKVFQIVDQLVVVQALKDMPAYDLDTVLFVEGGQPLGKIFDVFGPVTEPYYCVRFNSREHIKERNINLDQMVYAAPKTKYTNYVFLSQLMKLKGSDASWENDDEPPEIFLDYSDDEQEQRAKKKKSRKGKAQLKVDSDPDEPARKKHFAYERRMNQRNLQLSAVGNQSNENRGQNLNGTLKPPTIPSPGTSATPSLFQNVCHQMFGRPPTFNMRVPHPNIRFSEPSRSIMTSIPDPRDVPSNFARGPSSNFTNPNNSSHFPHPFSQRPGASPSLPIPNPMHGPSNFTRGSSPNSNNSSHFSHPFPQRPGSSPSLPNSPVIRPYPFLPTQMPGPLRLPFRQEPNNRPNLRQPCGSFDSSWASSPPRGNIPVANNNMFPSSPFWIRKPPPSLIPNIQTPFPVVPNRSYLPPPLRPPHPFRNIQSPPQPSNTHTKNTSEVNFNPHVPPPSLNPFNKF